MSLTATFPTSEPIWIRLGIIEKGVIANGIFDDIIVDKDPLIYRFTYSGGLDDAGKVVIKDWAECVKNK